VHVGGTHAAELILGPLLGFDEVGRAGEARADAVEQAAGIFEDVRVVEALVADAAMAARSSVSAVG